MGLLWSLLSSDAYIWGGIRTRVLVKNEDPKKHVLNWNKIMCSKNRHYSRFNNEHHNWDSLCDHFKRIFTFTSYNFCTSPPIPETWNDNLHDWSQLLTHMRQFLTHQSNVQDILCVELGTAHNRATNPNWNQESRDSRLRHHIHMLHQFAPHLNVWEPRLHKLVTLSGRIQSMRRRAPHSRVQ